MPTNRKKIDRVLSIVMLFVSILFLFPCIWVIISSFKGRSELFSWPPSILPKMPTLENYVLAFEKGNFPLYFLNSAFVAVVATLLTLAISLMAGYAFAKYQFPFRNLLFAIVMATMMIPLEIIMIPVFRVIVATKMYNSLWGVIIPAVATPTGTFMMRQAFIGVPSDYMEAARIDGAGETRTFIQIMAPLVTSTLSVLAIISFMWRWNDYLWPLLVISSKQHYTLQLALASFSGEYSVDWNSLLAMSVLSMIPTTTVFIIFQKQIIGGMTLGGIKG